jgi:hypothetical protein
MTWLGFFQVTLTARKTAKKTKYFTVQWGMFVSSDEQTHLWES